MNRLREWTTRGGIRIFDLMEDLPDHGNRRNHQFLSQVETSLFRNPLIRYKKIRGSRYWFFVNQEKELDPSNSEEENSSPPPQKRPMSGQYSYSPPRSPSYDPMMD
jgi:hypothetical protein